MRAGDALSLWGLTLVILPGFLGNRWEVLYQDNPVCTVRGSTVLIRCVYDYPTGFSVKEIMWCQQDTDCIETSYVCHSENFNLTEAKTNMETNRHRTECLGDKNKNCTLKITNARITDAGEYRFRFTTDRPSGRWTSLSGLKVYVHELRVVMTSSGVNGPLREGDSVNLTCDTGCSLSQSEFTWFKDEQPLPETQSTLHLDPVSYRHLGKYSCALKGHTETVSDVFILNVQYESHMTTTLIIVGVVLPVLIVIFLVAIVVKRMKGTQLRKGTSGTVRTQIADEHVHGPDMESTYPPSMAQRLDASPQEEEACGDGADAAGISDLQLSAHCCQQGEMTKKHSKAHRRKKAEIHPLLHIPSLSLSWLRISDARLTRTGQNLTTEPHAL